MKEVYLLRHAEKDSGGMFGVLTKNGESQARELGKSLPSFAYVYSSPSDRALATAKLLSGIEPQVDERADFAMTTQDKSDDINALADRRQISFLEAVHEYGDADVLKGIEDKATGLNAFVDEVFTQLGEDERCLILSHDLTICPAMAQRGIPLASIGYLCGYIINQEGTVTEFQPSLGNLK